MSKAAERIDNTVLEGTSGAANVPIGYKCTEVGVIPEDWQVSTIGSVAEIRTGGTPSTQNPIYWNGPIPWCVPTDVTRTPGKYLSTTERRITESGLANSAASMLPPGSLLLCTRATVGDVRLTTIPICTNQGFKPLVCKEGMDNEFLYYVLLPLKQRMVQQASGSTFLEIGKRDLASFQLPIPPPAEQAAIAEALSDVDRLLELLDALIAKKRAIKQATMQQLLTGKTRLPGLSGKWEKMNMGQDSILKARIGWQGLTTEEYLTSGDYYLVTGTDFLDGRVDWSNCCFVDRTRYVQDRNIQLAPRDVLLTKDGTIGKAGFIESLPGPATLNSGIFVIRPKNGAYFPLYMYYVLTSSIFDAFLVRLQAGSTISHLYQKDFTQFTFHIPELAEQAAIAAVLSDMDDDIAVLRQRRNKARAVKESMMQQLLSGQVRLV